MKQSRKKRRSIANKNQNDVVMEKNGGKIGGENDEQLMIINNLMEAFSLTSIDEVQAALREANGDPNKAVDILNELSDGGSSDAAYQASCSSSNVDCNSSSGLSQCMSLSEGFTDSSGGSVDEDSSNGSRRGNKGKKVAAVAGSVASLLGKDYVKASSRKEVSKEKGMMGVGGKVDFEEAEQFLCSMLGDDCELNMGVVKDVLCNCGYDVEKALEILLDLSAPPSESASDKNSSSTSGSEGCFSNIDFSDNFWQLTDKSSDSNSYCSESDVQDCIQFFDYTGRNYAEALLSSDSSRKFSAANSVVDGDELPQRVLESLFKTPQKAELEPSKMDWRNVAKQMQSFAQKRVELGPSDSHKQQMVAQAVGKGAEYQVFRETARERWDKTKTCYLKAATAYSNGEKSYAAYMSDQGKSFSRMAREADEKASMEIFKARNKGIENFLTIDLHGQHVKPAMKLVKMHILFATHISSVQYIRIITGCGSRGLGKSVLKQSVMELCKKERIEWREENQGTVLLKLDGQREFSFLDSESDSESELCVNPQFSISTG